MTKLYVAVIASVVLFGLAPWIGASIANHGPLRVPPEFTDDSGYYYAQVHDVAIGYPFIGNPYFKEYANEPAASFFGADWIAAVPLLVGIPIVPAIMLDAAVAFAIFAVLLSALAHVLGMRRWWPIALLAAVLSVSYWLMIRPVSMQVVFPCFVFFLLSYFAWLTHSASRRAQIAFVVSSALSFYIYTYLWQIVVIVFGLTHLYFFVRDRTRLLPLLWIDVTTIVLSLPAVWYTYMQINQPWYWQTMIRTGFVATHTFGSSAVIAALITIVMLGALWILCKDRTARRTELLFFGITGVALLIASFSNVITGKDMEAAIHFIRFTYLWAALAGVYSLFSYFGSRHFNWRRDIFSRYGLCTIVILAFFAFFLAGTFKGFPTVMTAPIVATQAYATPLMWLNEHTPQGSVIFADDQFSYYIPVMTRDYVLFQPDGGVYLMPDVDVQNRYLASRIFDNLSLTDIEHDLRLYAGAGNANDGPETLNRSTKFCMLLIRTGCLPLVSAVNYMGLPYFNDLYERYQVVVAHPEATLAHYGVSYIIKDTLHDPQMQPQKLLGTTLIATLGRFEIYQFSATSSADGS